MQTIESYTNAFILSPSTSVKLFLATERSVAADILGMALYVVAIDDYFG